MVNQNGGAYHGELLKLKHHGMLIGEG